MFKSMCKVAKNSQYSQVITDKFQYLLIMDCFELDLILRCLRFCQVILSFSSICISN